MSHAFASSNQRGPGIPFGHSTVQKLLDENSLLIRTITEYQGQGRLTDCLPLSERLQRNLTYLASICDVTERQSLINDIEGANVNAGTITGVVGPNAGVAVSTPQNVQPSLVSTSAQQSASAAMCQDPGLGPPNASFQPSNRSAGNQMYGGGVKADLSSFPPRSVASPANLGVAGGAIPLNNENAIPTSGLAVSSAAMPQSHSDGGGPPNISLAQIHAIPNPGSLPQQQQQQQQQHMVSQQQIGAHSQPQQMHYQHQNAAFGQQQMYGYSPQPPQMYARPGQVMYQQAPHGAFGTGPPGAAVSGATAMYRPSPLGHQQPPMMMAGAPESYQPAPMYGQQQPVSTQQQQQAGAMGYQQQGSGPPMSISNGYTVHSGGPPHMMQAGYGPPQVPVFSQAHSLPPSQQ